MFELVFSKQAAKDAKKLASSNLKPKAMAILQIMQQDPFATYPPYEKLFGDLEGCYSRRINKQHRIVYEVREKTRTIVVHRMWTHYE